MCAGASQVQKQVKPLAMGKGRGGKENDPLAGCDGQGLPQLGGVLRTGEEYAGVNAVGNDRNGDSRQSRGCRRPPGDPAGAAHNSQPVPPLVNGAKLPPACFCPVSQEAGGFRTGTGAAGAAL